MTLTVRRTANTETIHRLWDAIVYIRQQRQTPNLERIFNHIRRKNSISQEELQKELTCALKDNLVEIKKSVSHKGSKVGREQDSYRIPEKEITKDGHDWYCFTCHKAGEVTLCSACHRVYHEDCLKERPTNNEKLVCETCKIIKSKDTLKMDKEDMNLLLHYAFLRLEQKLPNNRELFELASSQEEKWRKDLLIYEPMDLSIMGDKSDKNVYKRLEEFQADVQTLVHNIVLYYGVHSSTADTARQTLRDVCYDLGEIRQCGDCYRTSNEKGEKNWFCKPCDPPHELVYARQKGYPYWPAKVISINNGIYDVRFFGGHHQRANIDKDNIKPITVNIQQLQLKRSVALNKALEELKKHQKRLGQMPAKEKKAKKLASPPSSANSSRSSSANRGRTRKKSLSSDEDDDDADEDDDENSSQDECPTSSSPKVPRFKDAPTPEDHNVVSSSCQETSPCPKVTVSTQTHKKLLASLIPPKPPKPEEKVIPPCDCEEKYRKMFSDIRERIEAEQKEEKDRSLRELAERLRQDFEEEKARVVAAAVEKVQAEFGEAKRGAEEQMRSSHQMEMAEVMERHRMELSETKKKQWCYNCEIEAIYHCCWNTSYCSVDCQQVHWHKEHKRTCRRKR